VISYLVSALSLGAITYILVMGLNVRWGWAGELDLAYYAFVALGAYSGAVLQLPPSTEGSTSGWILGLQWPFVAGLAGGTVVAAAASALVGAVALRKLRGEYLAITTVAFTFIAAAIFSQDARLFDGFNGVYGLTEPFRSPQLLLGFLCVLALAVYLVLEALYRSPFGRTLRMIREDQVSAAAFGRNVYVAKLKAYVIGGACAGFGGALLAQWLSAFNPYAWSTTETFLLYTAIFIGGQGNLRGILIGTLVALVVIPQATLFLPVIAGHSDLWPAMRSGLSGILIILALRFRPQGLLPEPRFKDKFDTERTVATPARRLIGTTASASSARPPRPAPVAAASPPRPPLLEVRGLSKSYGGVQAVRNLDLIVAEGEPVGLIGANGAGKSTAIELISGFTRPDAGVIRFAGREIQGKAPHAVARAGLIRTFQTPREWARLTVLDNLLGAAPQDGLDRAWKALAMRPRLRAAERADLATARDILRQFGLFALRDEYAGNLSGGQKRLLEFARVAMTRPRMVLLDEPLAGVNPILQKNILEAIVDLTGAGIAVLLIEHNLQFVEATCSRVVVMALGEDIASGSMNELRRNPAVVDAYLGEAQASA
jgi:branched-chain amino acid transport system permease protein